MESHLPGESRTDCSLCRLIGARALELVFFHVDGAPDGECDNLICAWKLTTDKHLVIENHDQLKSFLVENRRSEKLGRRWLAFSGTWHIGRMGEVFSAEDGHIRAFERRSYEFLPERVMTLLRAQDCPWSACSKLLRRSLFVFALVSVVSLVTSPVFFSLIDKHCASLAYM